MSPSFRPTQGKVLFIAAGTIAVVLLGVAVYVLMPRGCGQLLDPESRTATGECVGLVEDSGVLDERLRPAARSILDENAKVAASGDPYVKIALLTPLSVAEKAPSAMSIDQVRYSLEGAATALHRVNSVDSDFGDSAAAKIQLLLVNQGSRQDYSDTVIEDILGAGDERHPLLAVVGLGSSVAGTEATVQRLSDAGLPMVSAVASATSLSARRFRGLHSVSPSNVDYALALKELLVRHHRAMKLRSGLIVSDLNVDDPYVRTLNQAFAGTMSGFLKFPPLPFRGSTVGQPAAPNVFDPVVTNLCSAAVHPQTPLDTVFFAGRVADFHAFALRLENRTCRNRPLAVLVGATGFHGAQQYEDVLKRGNVTVIYASSADSPAWINGAPDTPEGFPRFRQKFRAFGYADASLVDGYAIMYHDAVATAVRAVRLAAQGGVLRQPQQVQDQFGNISQAYRVRGASGTLSFAGRPDGRAAEKVVVYRQLGIDTPRLPAGLAPYLTTG